VVFSVGFSVVFGTLFACQSTAEPKPNPPVEAPPSSPKVESVEAKATPSAGLAKTVEAVVAKQTTPAMSAPEVGADAGVPWVDASDGPGLLAALRTAEDEGRGVFVDVGATWCVPCRELAEGPLKDPAVVSRLAKHFVAIRLDVTDGAPEQVALQSRLSSETLPDLLVWPVGSGVAKAFAGRGPLPPPSHHVRTFVEADVIVDALDQVLADRAG
ncbi:MAG: thioredoxin family protein, partial [Myxococcota bacterium]